MKPATETKSGHSADVYMELRINTRTFPIAQLGPDFLILKTPTDHPPANAEITMTIDQHAECWQVYLPDGLETKRRKTGIARLAGFNGSTVG